MVKYIKNLGLIKLAVGMVMGGLGLLQVWTVWGENEPANKFSAPLMPAIGTVGSWLGLNYDGLTWIVIALALGVFAVFWSVLSKYLANNWGAGLVTGLLLLLPIKLMAVARVEAVSVWGDGAHVVALTILPIVLIWWIKYLRTGKYRMGLASAAGLAVLALISPFGLIVSAMIMSILLFSEMLLGYGRLKLARAVFVVAVGGGLLAWWYHPAFIYESMQSSQGGDFLDTLTNLVPISFVVVPVLATFGYLFFEKRQELQAIFVSVFLTILFIVIAFARNAEERLWYVPFRFMPELAVAMALLGGAVADWGYRNRENVGNFKFGKKMSVLGKRFGKILMGGLLVVWLTIYAVGLPEMWEMAKPVENQSVVVEMSHVNEQMESNLTKRRISVGQVGGMGISLITIGFVIWLDFKLKKWSQPKSS